MGNWAYGMYCDGCHLTFGLGQTRWRAGGFLYHGDCLTKAVQKLRNEGKNKEADDLRYHSQVDNSHIKEMLSRRK